MSQFIPYPAWVYHATEKPRIVHSTEDEAALGPGWADTPAAFAQAPVGVPPAQPPAPAGSAAPHPQGGVPPEGASAVPDEALTRAAEAASIYQASAVVVIGTLATASKETLLRVRGYEVENPKYPGGRKGVLAAIDVALVAAEAAG